MSYFLFKRRRRNTGYTERLDGTALSERALAAEEDGKFTQGKFRTVYGVSKKDFDALVMLGVVTTKEWHHTGKSFTKNDFFEWDDDDFAGIYEVHKAEIAQLSAQLAIAEWSWKEHERQRYVMAYESFVINYINDHKYDEVLQGEYEAYCNRQQAISDAGSALGSNYERYMMHHSEDERWFRVARETVGEDTLRKAYDERYADVIQSNEELETVNADIKSANLTVNGKETLLMNIAQYFYEDEDMYNIVYEASQKEKAAEESRKSEAERKVREAERKALQAAVDKKQNEYLQKCLKSGKAECFNRTEEVPELSHVTLKEMQGKYGWFTAKYGYNLPIYYTGYKFADKRTLNHYKKLGTIQTNQL